MASVAWYLRRLQRMPPAEVPYRCMQTLKKTYDKHLLRSPAFNPGAEGVANIPGVDLGGAKDIFPGLEAELTAQAQQVAAHRFTVFGIDVGFGPAIDWHLDPKTGRRWPLEFWGDIDYRDGTKIGGIKFAWELNRLHHLPLLALAHGVTKLFAQSETIRERLRRWGDIPSEVLYPPPPQRPYRREAPGNYVFSISRLHKLKRLDLLVEAFRYVRDGNLQARIAGDGPEMEPLAAKIRELGFENRIRLLGRADEEMLVAQYAGALAVYFCPLNEDYGLVTPEAFASGKPVITARDSGGPAELVRDGETGYIVAPDPREVAAKLDALAGDKALAERMGAAAYEFVSGMTWEKAVGKLIL